MGRKKKGGRKWIGIGVTGLIIFLIAFTNAIGYIGNALSDTTHQWIWWTIFGIVCVTTAIVELTERRVK